MDQIVYHDRYRDETRVEQIYGDAALRWTYGTRLGNLSLNTVVKRAIFSRWYGRKMDAAKSRLKIPSFIEQYELDPTEFELTPAQFANFNEFFYRKLKPTARPIDPAADSIVFPADGRHLCIPDLSKANGLFVKGQMFSLKTLLDDEQLSEQFAGGSLLLSRLCPVDYHRFHFPVAGTPQTTRRIPGPLFSVNPIALRKNIEILATNKRTVTVLQTQRFGRVLLLEIGATCVGSICQTFAAGQAVEKGDEKGYFKFGGSSTILIFEPDRIEFAPDLIQQSRHHRELYARIGDVAGHS